MLIVERMLPLAQERLMTIRDDGLLLDAAGLLKEPRVNLIIVCEGSGKMAGVITKTDVVRRISYCAGSACTTAAAQVMTKDVTFCRPKEWLHDVWAVIKQHGLKNMPIIDDESKPLGILNARDAVQALLEDVQYEEEILRDYVSSVGYR